MILKKIIILVLASISVSIFSQNNVCESSSEFDIMMELNNIDKCYIKDTNKSDIKDDVAISTRSRYVRTKSNSHISNIKKSLNVNSINSKTTNTPSIKKTKNYVKFKNLTQAPVLLTLKGASDYKDDFKKALQSYVSDNIVYPSNTTHNGTEAIVWASFIIDSKGVLKNIVTSGPMNGEAFETETERILKTIPNFIPGKLNGEYVNVKYLMTVDFKLNK